MLHSAAHIPATVPGSGWKCSRDPVGPLDAVLDVVAVVSNPIRYHSRYRIYRDFERHMLASGVRLTTVELAFGDRPYELTQADNPRHVQLRTSDEIWHKENLINIGISRLPIDWKYVAWIDADIQFNRPDWAQETLQALQHYDVVQPFSHSINMCPKYHPIFDSTRPNPGQAEQRKIVASWLFCHINGVPRDGGPRPKFLCDDYHKFDGRYVWHSGFAWAARRSAIDTMGGLLDWAILGSADRHMADMMIGFDRWNRKLHPNYRHMLDLMKARIDRMNGNFGYVDGLVTHAWHGKLVNRFYADRWKILFKHQFDPVADLYRDWQGLWQLTPDKPGLRDDIRAYFRARAEDATEI